MKLRILVILISFSMTACKSTKKIKQWNLNQTVGWTSLNPNDFTVLFIQWNQGTNDSTQLSKKREFDEAVLKELKSKHLGDQAENDEQTERDLHFLVAKNYRNAEAVILSVSKRFDVEQKVTIYKRKYDSSGKWEDNIIYP